MTARGEIKLEHLGGVPWWEAKVPWRFHGCWAQTIGWMDDGWVLRCPCGALSGRGAHGEWIWRNSRKKEGAR